MVGRPVGKRVVGLAVGVVGSRVGGFVAVGLMVGLLVAVGLGVGELVALGLEVGA